MIFIFRLSPTYFFLKTTLPPCGLLLGGTCPKRAQKIVNSVGHKLCQSSGGGGGRQSAHISWFRVRSSCVLREATSTCGESHSEVVGGSGVSRPDDDEVTMIDCDESDAELVNNEDVRNAGNSVLFMRGLDTRSAT